ncbi:hypothetical protein QUB08_18075 [Microcoleus sp. BR0-C5]|uniref:hypothetical protein n=1 Tax=Microcoleus sp. BR0-C5 TaxID=2818713 RepID=UPI002FCFE81F
MKLNLAIPGLLIALLVGCNDTTTVATSPSPSVAANPTSNPVVSEQTPTPTPTPVVSEKIPTPTSTSTKPTNPFDSDSFPKAGCGDKMPTVSKTDTVNLYPVFVDYSDSNLQTIKDNYCGDAFFKITTKDQDKKYVIQVASFTSEERANQFKEFLGTKLSSVNAKVGEPTVRAVKPQGDVKTQGETANESTNISSSASSIGKAAQLTPKQIKELIEMENRLTVPVEQSNLKLEKVKAILPTYVPPGFEVKDFSISLCDYPGKYPGEKLGRYSYFITYSNSSNSSFYIQTRPCRVYMSKPTVVKDIQISSNKFAQINLQLIKFDRSIDNTKISGEILSSHPEYPGDFQKILSLTSEGSNPINWQEARKIMESMDYLNNQN